MFLCPRSLRQHQSLPESVGNTENWDWKPADRDRRGGQLSQPGLISAVDDELPSPQVLCLSDLTFRRLVKDPRVDDDSLNTIRG